MLHLTKYRSFCTMPMIKKSQVSRHCFQDLYDAAARAVFNPCSRRLYLCSAYSPILSARGRREEGGVKSPSMLLLWMSHLSTVFKSHFMLLVPNSSRRLFLTLYFVLCPCCLVKTSFAFKRLICGITFYHLIELINDLEVHAKMYKLIMYEFSPT